MKRERYPFAASSEGLLKQTLLLLASAFPGQGHIVSPEWKFHPKRRWRFDGAIPSVSIGIEYHGGLFMARRGGHQSVKGTRNDWEKLNEAQMLGWMVLQFGPDETRTGTAMQVIERAIRFRMEGQESSGVRGLPKSGLVFTSRQQPRA